MAASRPPTLPSPARGEGSIRVPSPWWGRVRVRGSGRGPRREGPRLAPSPASPTSTSTRPTPTAPARPARSSAQPRRSAWPALAITDHDTLSAIAVARPEAERLGIELIAGIELTAEREGKEIHLLGHFVRDDDPALLSASADLRAGRAGRIEAMADRLRGLGLLDRPRGDPRRLPPRHDRPQAPGRLARPDRPGRHAPRRLRPLPRRRRPRPRPQAPARLAARDRPDPRGRRRRRSGPSAVRFATIGPGRAGGRRPRLDRGRRARDRPQVRSPLAGLGRGDGAGADRRVRLSCGGSAGAVGRGDRDAGRGSGAASTPVRSLLADQPPPRPSTATVNVMATSSMRRLPRLRLHLRTRRS